MPEPARASRGDAGAAAAAGFPEAAEAVAASETPLMRAGAMMESTCLIWASLRPVWAARSCSTFFSLLPRMWPMIFPPSSSSASLSCWAMSFLFVCWDRAPRRDSAPLPELVALPVMYLSRSGIASIISFWICLLDRPVFPETEPTDD